MEAGKYRTIVADPPWEAILRAALSWIEESSPGERHRTRGLEALGALLAELARLQRRETELTEELYQLATCANMLLEGLRDEDSVERLAAHRIMEGIEFSVMRAVWVLGECDEAARIHALIGDHSPDACPICTPDRKRGAA